MHHFIRFPLVCLVFSGLTSIAFAADEAAWPPAYLNGKTGTIVVRSDQFLEVPEFVQSQRKDPAAAAFVVAKKAPTVALAYHRDLGPDAVHRVLWSSWGDMALARDGKVYCAIGDHGDYAKGDARCFLYVWDPDRQTLDQIVDMNKVVPPQPGQPAWSKVHAKIDEGADGKIYFCCTLNDGERAAKEQWTEQLPGSQIYQYDPQTRTTRVFANLPPKRCTATSLFDRERSLWWCTLEGGDHALWALDLKTGKSVFQGPAESVKFNRSIALARDGSVYFNGDKGLWKCDQAAKKVVPTKSKFDGPQGMRSSSAESKAGLIYGTTMKGQLFQYAVATDELKMLGPAWLKGDYVTVCVLSPDERFVYYLPGAHGQATQSGTPVLQYEVATGRLKVVAFLAKAIEQETGYVPAGTYGMKISADGSTVYVNFNGHATDRLRPKKMPPNGFGLCGFAAIHIPDSER